MKYIDITKINNPGFQGKTVKDKRASKSAVAYSQDDKFATVDEYVSNSNKKKRETAMFSIGAALLISVLGVVLGGKFLPSGIKNQLNKFIQEKTKKGGNEVRGTFSKIGDCSKKALNASMNFNSAKDAFMKKIYEYFPPLKWLDEKSSNLYRKCASGTIGKAFSKIRKMFMSSDDLIAKTVKNIPDEKLSQEISINGIKKTVKKWLDEIQDLAQTQRNSFDASFNQKSQQAIFENLDNTFKNISSNYRKTFVDTLTTKGQRKGIFNFMVSDMVQNEKAKHMQDIQGRLSLLTSQDGSGYTDKINLILQGLSDNKIIDKEVYSKKIAPLLSAIKKRLTRNSNIIANDAFDKFRDINVGSAPSDILGILGSAGLLGLYTAQAKSKEERTSVALTTAIPLGLGISSTIFSTLTMKSGFKSLAIGTATSLVSSIIGKSLDKIYRKKHNMDDKKPSIPIIEIPQTITDTGITNIVDKAVTTVIK